MRSGLEESSGKFFLRMTWELQSLWTVIATEVYVLSGFGLFQKVLIFKIVSSNRMRKFITPPEKHWLYYTKIFLSALFHCAATRNLAVLHRANYIYEVFWSQKYPYTNSKLKGEIESVINYMLRPNKSSKTSMNAYFNAAPP